MTLTQIDAKNNQIGTAINFHGAILQQKGQRYLINQWFGKSSGHFLFLKLAMQFWEHSLFH